MERKRQETSKNARAYIAVSCCVAIIAMVGYASWFSSNLSKKDAVKDEIKNEIVTEIPELSKGEKLPIGTTVKKEQKSVSVKEKSAPVAKNVIVEDKGVLKYPVDAKIKTEFSGDKLIYSATLDDWRAHKGIDFDAKEGEEVLAAADGVVLKVFSDSMGNSILIEHENGLKTLYQNVKEKNDELLGKNVKCGEKIATVGSSVVGDIEAGAFLHFEVWEDDIPKNPLDYLK